MNSAMLDFRYIFLANKVNSVVESNQVKLKFNGIGIDIVETMLLRKNKRFVVI